MEPTVYLFPILGRHAHHAAVGDRVTFATVPAANQRGFNVGAFAGDAGFMGTLPYVDSIDTQVQESGSEYKIAFFRTEHWRRGSYSVPWVVDSAWLDEGAEEFLTQIREMLYVPGVPSRRQEAFLACRPDVKRAYEAKVRELRQQREDARARALREETARVDARMAEQRAAFAARERIETSIREASTIEELGRVVMAINPELRTDPSITNRVIARRRALERRDVPDSRGLLRAAIAWDQGQPAFTPPPVATPPPPVITKVNIETPKRRILL